MCGRGMPGFARSRAGFTLIEIMVAVAITGLVIAGGFQLLTVSLWTLSEVRLEQELVDEAQKVYLEYMTREDMPNRGEKNGVRWRIETDSITIDGFMELAFRKLIVEYQGREMTLYLPE